MGRMIEIQSGEHVTIAYEAKPTGKVRGGILLIHEVWGLADHIKDVADRYAREGYLVVAPELLAGVGINPEAVGTLNIDLFNPAKRNEAQPKLRKLMAPMQSPEFGAATLESLRHVFDYLFNHEDTAGQVAVVGYCFGGTYSYSLAIAEERLKAAIPYYGPCDAPVDELRRVSAPILAFYGANDEGLVNGIDDLKERMSIAGVDFAAIVYPNCGHAFFNDGNPFSYNEVAATDAYSQTLDFLDKHLALN